MCNYSPNLKPLSKIYINIDILVINNKKIFNLI